MRSIIKVDPALKRAGYYPALFENQFKMSSHFSTSLYRDTKKVKISSTMRGDWQVYLDNRLVQSFSPSSGQNYRACYSGYPDLHIIAITNNCNQRCAYCQASAGDDNGKTNDYEMDLKQLDKIVSFILQNSNNRITVEFQGGEPLLKFNTISYLVDKFKEASKYQEKAIRFRLVSNLTMLNEEIASYLAQHSFAVSTSLDGLSDLHDKNRKFRGGDGSYSRVIAGINLLFNYRISPSVLTVVTNKSLQFPREIIDNLVQIGVHQVFLKPVYPLGYGKKLWHRLGVDPGEYGDFWKKALLRCFDYNLAEYPIIEVMFSFLLQKVLWGQDPRFVDLNSPCGAIHGQIAYDLQGNIYTCDEGRFGQGLPVGNVATSTFEDISHHPLTLAFRSASRINEKYCGKCAYQPWCGRCPVMAYHEHGNIDLSSEKYFYCKMIKSLFDAFFELIVECPQELKVASRIINLSNLFKSL